MCDTRQPYQIKYKGNIVDVTRPISQINSGTIVNSIGYSTFGGMWIPMEEDTLYMVGCSGAGYQLFYDNRLHDEGDGWTMWKWDDCTHGHSITIQLDKGEIHE